MRRLLLALMFLGFSASSACSCGDEPLETTCPAEEQLDKQCFVHDNGSWVFFEHQPGWNIGSNSACSMGHTECNPDTKEVSCEGFVWSEPEICGDGIDNDCDWDVDEGFDEDEDGFKTCDNDCNDNDPTVNPNATEDCDDIDNDCDGTVDGFSIACWAGNPNAILDGTTSCREGTDVCLAGAWIGCANQVLDEPEQCNLIDDDCDGIVDNNVVTDGANCGPPNQVGACTYGTETCVNGESYCIDAVTPTAEVCDNINNNCIDGTDEDLIQLCSTICGEGYEYCDWGNWVGCTAPQPTEEICDGFDNNCDGEVDEGCDCINSSIQTCRNGMFDEDGNPITCGLGIQVCENGKWGACNFWGTSDEECNNWDDDCDGTIDGMSVACGDPTYAGIGLCKLGELKCDAGVWSDCDGAVNPENEICDNLDNDCDGSVDEDLDPNAVVDMVFVIDMSGSMCNKIEALHDGILNYVADFEETDHLFGLVVFPTIIPGDEDVGVITAPALTDVNSFVAALAVLGCNAPATEPSYDALQMVTDSSDPLSIGWREEATPYVVLITDEQGQTYSDVTETDVASQTINCEIGNCEPGEKLEIFTITNSAHFYSYDEIVYFEAFRMYNLMPVNEARYTDVLRDIFENVCFY